ncbi:phage tail protein [Aeromonas media]|uniref:phage tail-collar fiber domain-containing protein n=1 Tax=Aeromonas media TaxID=651 RepID=UPI0038506E73
MSAIYSAIPTHDGQAKITNAIALGVPLKITHMAVGDGNEQPVTPNPAQTKLVRERRRAPLNALFQDPLNPAQLVAQQIIPENEGGWWIHEVGLFDESGTLIAIANAPPTYKPQMSEGSGRTQGINVVLIVSDTSAVELKIDPSVVLATRKYADDVMKMHIQSRNHPDATEIEKGFSRHATYEEITAEEVSESSKSAVVTIKRLFDWARESASSLIGVRTSEKTLESLLSADDMAIKYGQKNASVGSRLSQNGCKVVLVGDSLSSFFNIDSVNTSSIFESYLRRKVIEFNSSAVFYNRAIGGKRYYDLGRDEPAITSLSSGYPWYDNVSKRWMSYIDDIKPDVIFLAFGMNDGDGWNVGSFPQPTFFKMMDELRSISSNPEIVFCTNILPSTSHQDTSSAEEQTGRDAMAGWSRSFAKKAGFSHMDIHRRFKCLRDGVDPCMHSYARKTIQKLVSLPYSHPEKCESYSARITLVDPAVATKGIIFNLSDYTNNILTIKFDPASGRWQTTVYTASAQSVGMSDQWSAIGPAPLVGTEIYFTINGDVVTVTIGINTYPVFMRNVVRFGGKFNPVITGEGDIKIDLMEGYPVPVKSELTDSDIYSTGVDGGNGINHPTAKASSRIYSRVVDDWFSTISEHCVEKKHLIDIDFSFGSVSVSNQFSPELCGDVKLSSVLTFASGALAYHRDSSGKVIGAVFGADNRAYIDKSVFSSWGGDHNKIELEIEFIAPSSQAYILSLGENTTSDRIIAQVSSEGRSRVTASISGKATDLFGSELFPYVPGRRYTMKYSLDGDKGLAWMRSPDGSSRGNIDSTEIQRITSASISKLKLGYVSQSTFGGNVIISRIKVWVG